MRAIGLYVGSGGVDDRTSLVRSDTAASYPDFVASVSAEFAALRDRTAALEAALAAHVVDPSAHREVVRAAEAVLGASLRMGDAAAQTAVPMQVPQESASKIMPWRSGDHVCVTLCFPATGGVRYLTGTTPVANTFRAAGSGRSNVAATVSVAARFPPADSPATTSRDASAPCSCA